MLKETGYDFGNFDTVIKHIFLQSTAGKCILHLQENIIGKEVFYLKFQKFFEISENFLNF